ncbi:MAG TPA: AAA family ATPase [Planctomycetaceae bacterium]|nr:AAA family ATPase [Planctomycetaceae bacterium]
MDKQNRKLSPMEFLAQLKATGKASKHLPKKGAASPGELNLDFSDLAAPSAPAADAPADSAADSAPAATATAVAELPADGNFASGDSPAANPADAASPAGEAPHAQEAALEAPAAEPSALPATAAHATAPEASPVAAQDAAAPDGAHLTELFERVNELLGTAPGQVEEHFKPAEPVSLPDTGLTTEEVEKLILKYLLARGSAVGRKIAQQVCLPFGLIDPLLKSLKQEQLIVFKGSATMGDYEYALTELGRERSRRYTEECTYFGAAPVCLKDYLNAMSRQSIAKQHATVDDLKEAFGDLIISEKMLSKLGPAINSGRGMFLFGEPGNGKTSIAERVTNCFGSTIWIPRALGIDGDVVRIYDPAVHELVDQPTPDGIFNLTGIDQRWIHIRRPTVVVGGELTMAELEVRQNTATKICEAPLQLKSNCGTLVIDDFGRQRMPVAELLNRWIVPLEKRYDFLNLPSGKKIQVPFDQIIIFSTNLEPRDLVDGAFLRRIPYKIQVPDPTPEQFHKLCEIMAPNLGFQYNKAAVEYLIEKHYKPINRPMRACQPRDLLLQVRNFCMYHNMPKQMTPEAFDFACENYFSIM